MKYRPLGKGIIVTDKQYQHRVIKQSEKIVSLKTQLKRKTKDYLINSLAVFLLVLGFYLFSTESELLGGAFFFATLVLNYYYSSKAEEEKLEEIKANNRVIDILKMVVDKN